MRIPGLGLIVKVIGRNKRGIIVGLAHSIVPFVHLDRNEYLAYEEDETDKYGCVAMTRILAIVS